LLLVNRQKGITLPVAAGTVIADSLDRVYIEQNGASVFVLENYPQSKFSGLVSQMRSVRPYLRSLAKDAQGIVRHPFLDKSGLAKGVWHDLKRL
jgi:hypothetical protein